MPQTTFRVVIIFIEAMYFFFKNGFTVHGLLLYPLSYPDYYIRRRIRTFDTQGVENNIELSSMFYRSSTEHYGAILKRSSGLWLLSFPRFHPGITWKKIF